KDDRLYDSKSFIRFRFILFWKGSVIMELKPRHIEFRDSIDSIINQPKVQEMSRISQHVNGISCLDHCLFVSYMSFAVCKKLGLDANAAARGALLHDLYLCNWDYTDIGHWKRLTIHPQMALENAREFGLSNLEKDIISKHMWPITLFHIPVHRESAVVNLADKICATAEMCGIYWHLKTKTQLRCLNRALA
ncbi:MAG: HDIG domain-containing protein, partial [Oscillospiraceae bacterium]